MTRAAIHTGKLSSIIAVIIVKLTSSMCSENPLCQPPVIGATDKLNPATTDTSQATKVHDAHF